MAKDAKKKSSNREGKRLVTCWLDEKEHALFKQKAEDAGMSGADWLRHRCIQTAPRRRRKGPDVVSLHRLIGQINSVGANVNQLARAANVNDAMPQLNELAEIKATLQEITSQVAVALGYDSQR